MADFNHNSCSKGLKDAGMAVYVELRKGDIPAARKALGMIVGRDTTTLDPRKLCAARWRL